MRRLFKYALRFILMLFFAIVLWIIGLLARLPLIPWIETDYFVTGTTQTLAKGFVLKQPDTTITKGFLSVTAGSIIKLEAPNEFPEDDQCFDFWFSSAGGKHLLTVNNFSLKIFDSNNSEIKPINSYLFWDDGSKDKTFNIENYSIDTYPKNKYVFFRTVFDIDDVGDFSITVKTYYSIDNRADTIDRKLFIDKKHRLTWNEFRVH